MVEQLKKWRNVSFKIYFAAIFILTLLLFILPIVICLRSKKTYRYVFNIQVIWSFVYRLFAVHPICIQRTEKTPKEAAIIIANHTSFLDIFLMFAIFPRKPFVFMGKSEILQYPLLNRLFKGFNIPVYRNDRLKAAKSLIQAKQKLAEGWSVVIFPEGGIPDADWPEMVPFKEGAFKLAKITNVPIIPITFLNHYRLFSEAETPFASAHSGISKILIHPTITVEQQKLMTEKELSDFAFKMIKKPLSL